MSLVNFQFISCCTSPRGVGEGTSSAYTGGGGAPPETGSFFRFQGYKRVGIS